MKKHLFIAAAAVLALASCTTSEETFQGIDFAQEEAQENAIQFGTYMGNQVMTRAGYEGSINTDVLKDNSKAKGFGVFAYYTGTKTYNGVNGASATLKPNFMWNQQVSWETGHSDEIGAVGDAKWTYSPLKYWPNEVKTTDVDDQDKDADNKPATTPNENGGMLSFFAYAPYVTTGSGTDGIMAITTNAQKGDPIITYKIAEDGEVVDLLWGTYSGTSTNVNNENNNGVTSTANDNPVVTAPLTSRATYQADILQGYTTNADLTKQKTDGTVGFAFKHALSKVGGSQEYSSSITQPHGLTIILDVDDLKGAEKGGRIEKGTVNGVANTKLTKVTVESIEITNDLNGDGDVEDTNVQGYSEVLKTKGLFNIATGKWDLTSPSAEDGKVDHKILEANAATKSAKLNKKIAEISTKPTKTTAKDFFAGTESNTAAFKNIEGVPDDVAINVYDEETNPLVFLPGTEPVLRVRVAYYVRTYDTNLEDQFSEVKQVIDKIVKFPKLELNKQYNVTMHLGLNSVKFVASVSDWQVDGDTNGDGTITAPEELSATDVHLPINVSSTLALSATQTKVAGTQTTNASKVSSIYTYYDAENNVMRTENPATGVSYESSKPAIATVDPASGVVNFLTANTGTTNKTVTITGTKGGTKGSIDIIQAPQALKIDNPAAINVDGASDKVVDLAIKDAAGNDINLTAAGVKYSIKVVGKSWTVTPTTTGAKITVPKGTVANSYTVNVTVNDTEAKTVTINVTNP